QVVVSDGQGKAVRAPGLAAWLARVAPRSVSGEVAVALVSDARIRALNQRFRHTDKPTDVLSCPSEDLSRASNRARRGSRVALRASRVAPRAARVAARTSPLAPRPSPLVPRPSPLASRSLGDIVISSMTARRQAHDAGHPYADELKVL